MSRSINEDKLCSAFYQSHDFLNFDLKKYDKYLRPLITQNISGIQDLPDLQSEFDTKNYEKSKRLLGAYQYSCSQEYNLWLNSLKFQFDSDILHKIMPPKSTLNQFFEDMHIRVPHEKTLLIRSGSKGATIVSVQEHKVTDYLRILRKNYGRGQAGSTKFKDVMKNKEFANIYNTIENFGTGTLLACRLTMHTNLPEQKIYKPERFSKDLLNTITNTRIVHYPMTTIIPTGVKISELDQDAKGPPIMLHDIVQLDTLQNAWFMSMQNPFTTPPLEGNDLFWDREDNKSMSRQIKNSFVKYKINAPANTIWHTIRQNVIHISVLTHPEFKDFCVSTLKRKGLQPNKTPYSSDNPYKQRPAWKPPFEHYMVTINVPDDVSNEAQSSTHKKRHHLVRGHLMRSSGKNSKDGFVWRKSHWRGNKKLGTVTKDYTMKIDERIDKKAV